MMTTAKDQRRMNRPRRSSVAAMGFIAVLVVSAAVHLSTNVGLAFSASRGTSVIAHRAGGSAGPENTVAGMLAAEEAGIAACEIDVQRTADGAYVLNHDETFGRVAGVDRRVSEMTLEEVRALTVDGEPVPTLEELLAAAGGQMTLLIELKGETADRQMADDVIRLVLAYGLVDRCLLISFAGELVDYIEEVYPEIPTCYLTFEYDEEAGQRACDFVGVKYTHVTEEVIAEAHEQGQGFLVWTVNDVEEIRSFLEFGADGVITDEIGEAARIADELRHDVERDEGPMGRVRKLFRGMVERMA